MRREVAPGWIDVQVEELPLSRLRKTTVHHRTDQPEIIGFDPGKVSRFVHYGGFQAWTGGMGIGPEQFMVGQW